jgi:hypothetical protein
MKFGHGFGLLILAIFLPIAGANENDADRYTLPPSKVYIEPCQREALLLHPGMIEKQRMQHRHGDFWMEYEIQARDGAEWIVLCDLANGSIIREQKLANDAY